MITAFLAVSANALDPQWKEHQDEHFKQLGLKPGDKIDKTNWKFVMYDPEDAWLTSLSIKYTKDGKWFYRFGFMGFRR